MEDKYGCGELVRKIENGEKKELTVSEILQLYPVLGIPHFQRGLVWSVEDVSSLLESLYEDTPCGSIVLWKKTKELEDYGEPLLPPFKEQNFFIIDGQQRIRSLLEVFKDLSGANEDEDEKEVECNSDDDSASTAKVWCINIGKIKELELKNRGQDRFRMFRKIRDPKTELESHPDAKSQGRILNNVRNSLPLKLFFPENGSNEYATQCIKTYKDEVNKISNGEFVGEINGIEQVVENVRKMLERKFFLVFLNESKNFGDVVSLYNRINSGGRKVEAEEKAFATLVQHDKVTNKSINALFDKIHEKKSSKRDYLARLRERSLGFKQYIRTFIQVATYHCGRQTAFSFSVLHDESLQQAIGGHYEQLWDEVREIVLCIAGEGGVLQKLYCDDLRFLPDSRSLWPLIQLLIRYPDLLKKEGDKYIHSRFMQYLCLRLFLIELPERNILEITKSIIDSKCIKEALEAIPTVDDEELKKRLEKSNSLQDRYVLLLYWLLRKQGGEEKVTITDFSYKNLDQGKQKDELEPGKEKVISSQCEPEKQHIVPYAKLKQIFKDLVGKNRMSTHQANNIGNLTYISSMFNNHDVGLGEKMIDTKIEGKFNPDNLTKHFLHGKPNEIYEKICNFFSLDSNVPGSNNKSKEVKEQFIEFCKERSSLIAEAFIGWLNELNSTNKLDLKPRRPLKNDWDLDGWIQNNKALSPSISSIVKDLDYCFYQLGWKRDYTKGEEQTPSKLSYKAEKRLIFTINFKDSNLSCSFYNPKDGNVRKALGISDITEVFEAFNPNVNGDFIELRLTSDNVRAFTERIITIVANRDKQ